MQAARLRAAPGFACHVLPAASIAAVSENSPVAVLVVPKTSLGVPPAPAASNSIMGELVANGGSFRRPRTSAFGVELGTSGGAGPWPFASAADSGVSFDAASAPPAAKRMRQEDAWGNEAGGSATLWPGARAADVTVHEAFPSGALILKPDPRTRWLARRIPYTGPDSAAEAALFALWATASEQESRAAVFQPGQPLHVPAETAAAARDAFLAAYGAHIQDGWAYDAGARRFLSHLPGIDSVAESTFFTHMPLGADGLLTLPRLRTHHRYSMRVVSPDTLGQNHELTVRILEKWLPRRFFGALPRSVCVIQARLAHAAKLATDLQEPAVTFSRDCGIPECVPAPAVTVLTVDAAICRGRSGTRPESAHTLGQRLNAELAAAMRMDADLVLLDLRALLPSATGALADGKSEGLPFTAFSSVRLDWLVPVYPVVVEPGALLLTRMQLSQINGISPVADSADGVILSLLARTAAGLGAFLMTEITASVVPAALGADVEFFKAGLSSLRDGIMTDGRCHEVVPSMSRYAPQHRHGWLAADTAALLAVAVRATSPAVILELGSWYGLSTRFMLSMAPRHTTLYAADWFKNNAHYTTKMWKLGPLDKMYLRHLRFESFHANVAPYLPGWEGDLPDLVAVADAPEGAGCAVLATPVASCAPAAGVSSPSPVVGSNSVGSDSVSSDTSRVRSDGTDSSANTRRVVMLKMDAAEAVTAIAAQRVSPDIVFIDCEKRKGPLKELLLRLRRLFPAAVIVGDDYVFPSVQDAIAELRLPFTLALKEAYAVFPTEASYRQGVAAAGQWIAALAPPPFESHLAKLVASKHWEEAISAVAAHTSEAEAAAAAATASPIRAVADKAAQIVGMPAGPAAADPVSPAALLSLEARAALAQVIPYCERERLHHEICRARDPDALAALWPRLFTGCTQWHPPILNHMNLSPFDYLSHNIRWG